LNSERFIDKTKTYHTFGIRDGGGEGDAVSAANDTEQGKMCDKMKD